MITLPSCTTSCIKGDNITLMNEKKEKLLEERDLKVRLLMVSNVLCSLNIHSLQKFVSHLVINPIFCWPFIKLFQACLDHILILKFKSVSPHKDTFEQSTSFGTGRYNQAPLGKSFIDEFISCCRFSEIGDKMAHALAQYIISGAKIV